MLPLFQATITKSLAKRCNTEENAVECNEGTPNAIQTRSPSSSSSKRSGSGTPYSASGSHPRQRQGCSSSPDEGDVSGHILALQRRLKDHARNTDGWKESSLIGFDELRADVHSIGIRSSEQDLRVIFELY